MPMAELPAEIRDRVLTIFLREYNQTHNSNYLFESEEPEDDRSCDYRCIDESQSREPLKIQHTLAAGNSYIERARPSQVDRIVHDYVIQNLRRQDHRGYSISINIDNPPRGREEVARLGDKILDCIESKAIEALDPRHKRIFKYSRMDFNDFIQPIKEYVSDFEIETLPNPKMKTVVSWSSAHENDRYFGPEQMVLAAIARKSKLGPSAKDLVLLITFDLFPYDPDIYIPEIRDNLRGQETLFKEIWLVNASAPSCDRADKVS